MLIPLENYLKLAANYLSDKIVSSEAISQINKAVITLPNIPSTSVGIFESRLGETTPNVDFSLCLKQSDDIHKIFAECKPENIFLNNTLANSKWTYIHNFCSHWNNITSRLYSEIPCIWLEFDVKELTTEHRIPSIFFCFDLRDKITSFLSLDAVNKYQYITENALELLLDIPISSRLKQNLLVCFELLPIGTQTVQIGVMLSRPSKALRFCIEGIPKTEVINYLNAIGWRGSIAKLEDIISVLSNLVDKFTLDIDVGESIEPKVGIECYLSKPPKKQRWKLFLDYLVDNQLCIPDKRDAILAWNGYSSNKLDEQLLFGNFLKFSNFLGSRVVGILTRDISHIKIVYHPELALEAKGYLYFAHNWFYPNL